MKILGYKIGLAELAVIIPALVEGWKWLKAQLPKADDDAEESPKMPNYGNKA